MPWVEARYSAIELYPRECVRRESNPRSPKTTVLQTAATISTVASDTWGERRDLNSHVRLWTLGSQPSAATDYATPTMYDFEYPDSRPSAWVGNKVVATFVRDEGLEPSDWLGVNQLLLPLS